jgi:hypothetical protein
MLIHIADPETGSQSLTLRLRAALTRVHQHRLMSLAVARGRCCVDGNDNDRNHYCAKCHVASRQHLLKKSLHRRGRRLMAGGSTELSRILSASGDLATSSLM